jgi:hypothetical protein
MLQTNENSGIGSEDLTRMEETLQLVFGRYWWRTDGLNLADSFMKQAQSGGCEDWKCWGSSSESGRCH